MANWLIVSANIDADEEPEEQELKTPGLVFADQIVNTTGGFSFVRSDTSSALPEPLIVIAPVAPKGQNE